MGAKREGSTSRFAGKPYTARNVHLSREELGILEEAAKAEGLTFSRFVKEAGLKIAAQIRPKKKCRTCGAERVA